MPVKRIKDIMHKGVITCAPDVPVQEVVRVVADTDVHAIIVVHPPEATVAGIISHIDLLRLYGKDLLEYTASDIMTADVIAVAIDAPVSEAAQLMLEKGIHRLLVTEDTPEGKKPIGVVSTTDIIRDMRGTRWSWYMA